MLRSLLHVSAAAVMTWLPLGICSYLDSLVLHSKPVHLSSDSFFFFFKPVLWGCPVAAHTHPVSQMMTRMDGDLIFGFDRFFFFF